METAARIAREMDDVGRFVREPAFIRVASSATDSLDALAAPCFDANVEILSSSSNALTVRSECTVNELIYEFLAEIGQSLRRRQPQRYPTVLVNRAPRTARSMPPRFGLRFVKWRSQDVVGSS